MKNGQEGIGRRELLRFVSKWSAAVASIGGFGPFLSGCKDDRGHADILLEVDYLDYANYADCIISEFCKHDATAFFGITYSISLRINSNLPFYIENFFVGQNFLNIGSQNNVYKNV